MNRPVNPYTLSLEALRIGYARFPSDGWFYGFEAGIKATVEALKEDGQFVNNDETQPYGCVLARSLKRGEKGWLVFIPDESSGGRE